MTEIGMFFICICVLCICVFGISIRVIVQIVHCLVHPLNSALGTSENTWRATDMRFATVFSKHQNTANLFLAFYSSEKNLLYTL